MVDAERARVVSQQNNRTYPKNIRATRTSMLRAGSTKDNLGRLIAWEEAGSNGKRPSY